MAGWPVRRFSPETVYATRPIVSAANIAITAPITLAAITSRAIATVSPRAIAAVAPPLTKTVASAEIISTHDPRELLAPQKSKQTVFYLRRSPLRLLLLLSRSLSLPLFIQI